METKACLSSCPAEYNESADAAQWSGQKPQHELSHSTGQLSHLNSRRQSTIESLNLIGKHIEKLGAPSPASCVISASPTTGVEAAAAMWEDDDDDDDDISTEFNAVFGYDNCMRGADTPLQRCQAATDAPSLATHALSSGGKGATNPSETEYRSSEVGRWDNADDSDDRAIMEEVEMLCRRSFGDV